MSNPQFAQKVRWIRRRAKRIQAFYRVSRPLAAYESHLDWICFMGLSASPRYAFLFNLDTHHHEKTR